MYAKMHAEAFDPLGYDSDLTLDSIGQHKSKKPGRAASVQSYRQSICCSSLHRQAIMNCSGNIRKLVNEEEYRN